MRIWGAFFMPFFWVVGLAVALASCSSDQQSDVVHTGGVFSYNESNGISSLDPAFSSNLENIWACNQLFDGLVALDSNLIPIPSVAASWQISDAGKTYTFVLRDDVFFHDNDCFDGGKGRRVVAQDFVYSFNRILADKTASPGRWVFDAVDKTRKSFSAPHKDTLVVKLAQPFTPFLGILAMQYCTVVPKEAIEKYGTDFRANPVGCGPFQKAFWYEGVSLVFHKNEKYFLKDSAGQPLPYLGAVKIDFVKDKGAAYLGLLQGKYHFMSGLHQSYKDELLDPLGNLNRAYADQIRFQRTPFIKTDYLGFLVDDSLEISNKSPLANVAVRRALNMAIDRKSMAKHLRNNAVYPAGHGFIPIGLPSFVADADYGFEYDLETARLLLAEAGFSAQNTMPAISVATTADYVDLCEFLQFEWQKIGVQLKIDVLPTATQRQLVSTSQVVLFRKSWLADYPDAENFLGLFYSKNFAPNGPNYTHFYSAQFDSLFVYSKTETDTRKRLSAYRKMDSLVMAQAPVVPLFYDQVSHFVRTEVSGLETNGINQLDLTTVKISTP